MPLRTPRTRPSKSRRATQGAKKPRRTQRATELRQELEGLYALDAEASSMTIAAPSRARWLRRVALLAPVAVAVQAFVLYGFPLLSQLLDRPEFVIFRIGE